MEKYAAVSCFLLGLNIVFLVEPTFCAVSHGFERALPSPVLSRRLMQRHLLPSNPKPPATTTAASAPCRHVTQPDVQPAPPCPSAAQTCTPGRLLTPRLRLRAAAVDMDTDQQIENYYQVRARLRAATRFR